MNQVSPDVLVRQDWGTAAVGMPGVEALSFVEALVDPAGVFRHPGDVVAHPGLTREEKRTILLSWARDELVLEQVGHRTLPELGPRSRIDAVIDALARFDASAALEYRSAVASIRARHPRRPCGGGRIQ